MNKEVPLEDSVLKDSRGRKDATPFFHLHLSRISSLKTSLRMLRYCLYIPLLRSLFALIFTITECENFIENVLLGVQKIKMP